MIIGMLSISAVTKLLIICGIASTIAVMICGNACTSELEAEFPREQSADQRYDRRYQAVDNLRDRRGQRCYNLWQCRHKGSEQLNSRLDDLRNG